MGMRGWGLLTGALLLAGCGQQPAPVAQCPDPMRGCRIAAGGVQADLRFASPPGTLRPFVLEVAAPGAKSVAASFTMVGMDMGENRYKLLRTDSGPWRAEIVLPVCVAGRAEWVMTLEVDGKSVEVPFVAAGRS
ncbi:MAG: hypothetical protein AB7U30_05555 [Sulfuricellaceae bacterium]